MNTYFDWSEEFIFLINYIDLTIWSNII